MVHRIGINYIVFNDLWDRVVDNKINQSLEPVNFTSLEGLYLRYLSNALSNLSETHSDVQVIIWLIEISDNGLKEGDLRNKISKNKQCPYIKIFTIPISRIITFIDTARQVPNVYYRSPNELHEYLLLTIVKLSPTPLVAIMDPDTLFRKKNALDEIFKILNQNKNKWVASILESGIKRPYNNEFINMRPRMHSVALFFIKDRFTKGFLETTNWKKGIFEKVNDINDINVVGYYQTYKFFDTLSLLTDTLKLNFESDRLLVLNEPLNAIELKGLTLINDYFIHCKYLQGKVQFIDKEIKEELYIGKYL
ncbi:MAG: hypothetical protein JXR64_13745 [Spirochaetales bacterium]|nr:hypothetical protein [Spirochaetales bacterium]